jgi:hypothetical protein
MSYRESNWVDENNPKTCLFAAAASGGRWL